MKVPHLMKTILLVALLLGVYTLGSAAALNGRVTEVVDGRTITVESVKHPVKVKLIGMAPPDIDQPYAEIARQHLSDLLLHKFVVVRYSRLQDGYILGQVDAGGMDAGAQMIRDGVGWYDKADETRLSDLERRLYIESEQAARSERRGLWQDESAVSPWDFRKAALARRNASVVPLQRLSSRARRGDPAGLSSNDLFGGVVGPGSMAGPPSYRKIDAAGAPGQWSRYQPEGQHFSILAPSDAVEISYPVLDGQGKVIEIRYVVSPIEGTLYVVMSAKGSNDNATDASVATSTVNGFLTGMNKSSEAGRPGVVLTSRPGRELSLGGFGGRQYSLSGGPLTGVVRVLSKQTGDQREIIMLCVLNRAGAEPADDHFLSSFKLIQNKAQ